MIKYLTCIILLLMTSSLMFSQEQLFVIKNDQLNKTITIKENRRVRIKMSNGKKRVGKLKIIDNQTISIRNQEIKISDIVKIKRNPLVLNIVSKIISIYVTAAVAIVIVVNAIFGGEGGSGWALIPASAFVYALISKPINVLKGYKTQNNWQYSIIPIVH